MSKVTAYILQAFEGSDDPRAIEGGGGSGTKAIEVKRNSLWLIKAYVRAINNKYGEEYGYKVISG
jgi:hypothetical protein